MLYIQNVKMSMHPGILPRKRQSHPRWRHSGESRNPEDVDFFELYGFPIKHFGNDECRFI